jgi:hypothetical protein
VRPGPARIELIESVERPCCRKCGVSFPLRPTPHQISIVSNRTMLQVHNQKDNSWIFSGNSRTIKTIPVNPWEGLQCAI